MYNAVPVSGSHPLAGRVLVVARIVWLALAAIQVFTFLSQLPLYFSLADHPCPQNCALTVQSADSLTHAGISPHGYVLVLLTINVISVAIAMTMAILLFLRRSYDRMALIAAYFIVILPTTLLINSGPSMASGIQTTAFALPLAVDLMLATLQTATIYGLFLVFPSGRFIPRWTWLLFAGFLAYTTLIGLRPDLQDSLVFGWVFFFGGAIANMVYRYRRISTPQERQQTKWVLFGFGAWLIISQAYWLPTFSPLSATAYAPLSYLLYQLCLPIVPITFFIAIQRYRLYDIDAIIRRTLVYAVLTAILIAIYGVAVLGAQSILHDIGGPTLNDSPPVIVFSTLAIATLFLPLRRRVQEVIDRRFYRSKYDAARILESFAAAMRGDLDLEHLRELLVIAVDESMHPAHISLWLRSSDQNARVSTGSL